MDNQISIEQIKMFSKKYNEDTQNKVIEKNITEKGLKAACISGEVIKENERTFNIELPNCKRQDQSESHRCWIYAGLNTLKYNISKNLNMDINELDLSTNYIAFFDRLEKANKAYENAINLNNLDFDYINKENIFRYAGSEGGRWEYFVAIINKYGLVPRSIMPDTFETKNWEKLERVYTEKVVKDVLKLLKLKEKNISIDELRKVKERFIEENYSVLSKILGEPKYEFTYEYKDINNEEQKIENITPLQFKERYLSLKVEDFVSIENMPMYNKEYYKIYRKKYMGGVIGKGNAQFLNLPIDEIKELVIKQLKDSIPVYMGVNITKFRDDKSGVLDTRLYNYKEMLGLEALTKKEALNMYNIRLHHLMVFCGVHLVNEKPVRWKVEDSYGNKEKFNGYYIMNDNYFDEFVINVVIDKKYLNEKQLKALEQEPIEIEGEEPS